MGIYRVEKGGSAPAGLQAGDRVVTGGGTYRITGVGANGKYKSELVDDKTTIHNYGGGYDEVGSRIPGGSKRTQERVSRLESGYTPSDATRKAQAYLEKLQGKKPGAYQSQWGAQLDALYDQITNREKFKYDVYDDPLYQQYKEQYKNLGRTAMMDTMGQAAALTGGYGSSYGQSVGQQTYDAYLQNMNDVVPELYGQAYRQYADEGTKLQNQYSMLLDRENADYNRYRDDVTDYMNELQLAMQAARNAESDDYDRYRDELSYWSGKLADEQSYYAAAQKAASGGSGGAGSAQSAGGQVSAPSFGSGVEARLYNSVYNGVKVYAQQGKDTEVDRLMSTIDGGLSREQYNKLAKLLNQYGYNLPVY